MARERLRPRPADHPEVARAIDDVAQEVGAPILVGAQEYPETGGRYNVSLLWEPGTGVVDRYAKQHPAPFGEYIPLRSLLRVFSDQVDRVSIDMIAGTETGVVDLDAPRLGRTVPLGVVICFEVAYDGLVNDAVDAGAELLVVPTNNASFGYTAESTQQLAMSRLRAVSTGRATVQVSTVGVSGVIAPDGTLLRSTGLFTADQMVADLPLRTSLTPAVRAGTGRVAWSSSSPSASSPPASSPPSASAAPGPPRSRPGARRRAGAAGRVALRSGACSSSCPRTTRR